MDLIIIQIQLPLNPPQSVFYTDQKYIFILMSTNWNSMDEKIYDEQSLVILKRANRYFIVYDVGAHYPVIREDEITLEQVNLVIKGFDDATDVLFSIQRKLSEMGINAYESNIKK